MHDKKEMRDFLIKWLPRNYGEMLKAMRTMPNKEAAIASLVVLVCDGGNMKAINLALDRAIGKVQRLEVVNKVKTRVLYTQAQSKALEPPRTEQTSTVSLYEDTSVVVNQEDLPSEILEQRLQTVGDKDGEYLLERLDDKEGTEVAELMAVSLYNQANMTGGANSEAIRVLFERIDGAVADVVNIYDNSMVVLPNFASIAPYNAQKDDNGTYYVDL